MASTHGAARLPGLYATHIGKKYAMAVSGIVLMAFVLVHMLGNLKLYLGAPRTLDAADGVISTCAVAIAQTGTIVLDGSAGMGRRVLSLVPDYHLCVVRADQLVGSVPEALARLEATRPLTFISGPSATVDIEMVRVGGVHGPRRLEVIVVG